MSITGDFIRSLTPVNKELVHSCVDGLVSNVKLASKQGLGKVPISYNSLTEGFNYMETKEYIKCIIQTFVQDTGITLQKDKHGITYLVWS